MTEPQEPSAALWHTIYRAAAGEGITLGHATVAAIANAVMNAEPSATPSTLERLIIQWRKRADDLVDDREPIRDDRIRALVLRDCATELAALRPFEGSETGRPPVESFDLGPIKAREAAATKGPWGSGPLGAGYQAICFYADGSWNNDLLCSGNNQADAEFCAKARLDIPALIAEVERLRALPAGPETGDRLLKLARFAAYHFHNSLSEAETNGGHHGPFATCPHPACVLVRQAAPAASEGQK